ncbi:MAG: serine/threonine protein kinase [Myxococcales bacterium]|nr:serine/threonine protein kinase [Myxococcales bacterium]
MPEGWGGEATLPVGTANEVVRPESALARGALVGNYEVVSLIGMGGMGVVYRARDRRLSRDVALKLIRAQVPGTSACGVMCSLLLHEARTMARLRHPNLVAVHDVGEFRGCVFVAMEFVEGQTLREWLTPARTWRERMDALHQAGRGLEAAHAAGVVHRDFKPDNVLVSSAGRVLVTDFGVARSAADMAEPASFACGCDTNAASEIDTGAVVGTPGYMSPEQHDGLATDARSDQFNFAVTAWEILYGQLPFAGASLAETRSALRAPPREPPTGEVPPEVLAVLRRGLGQRASARFPSMADFLERLERAAS